MTMIEKMSCKGDTQTGVIIAEIGMSIAVAWNTLSKGPSSWRIMSISRLTVLTKLTNISNRTSAVFDPRGSGSIVVHVGRFEFDIVQETCSVVDIASSDFDGS